MTKIFGRVIISESEYECLMNIAKRRGEDIERLRGENSVLDIELKRSKAQAKFLIAENQRLTDIEAKYLKMVDRPRENGRFVKRGGGQNGE